MVPLPLFLMDEKNSTTRALRGGNNQDAWREIYRSRQCGLTNDYPGLLETCNAR
jgi:hypothetical protein